VTSVAMAICGSYFISLIPAKAIKYITAGIIVLSCIVLNLKLFRPQYIYSLDYATLEDNMDIRYRVSKISDEYLSIGFKKPTQINDIANLLINEPEGLVITARKQSDTENKVSLDSNREQRIIINKAYFPGWKYILNGLEIAPQIISGLPSIRVPSGHSELRIYFTNTMVRTIANWISIVSFGVLVIYILYGKETNS
jgi:hypothetical protein